ncbi:MAG: MFS transporter [Burkholderiales bacterium]
MIRGLPATVWMLGAISFLNDAASDLVYPLVPLFVAQVLGASPRALGVIEGLANATAALRKLVSGALYDRFPRAKGWLVAGYGLPAIARPAIAFAGSTLTLGVLRVADRIGKGLRSAPRDALLARSVEPARRGLAFGVHRSMDHAGAVAGPLAAAALLAGGMGLREIFLWTLIPGIACVALALAVREPPGALAPAARIDWSPGSLPPRFRAYLAIVALFTLSQASNLFLLLRAAQLGVPAASIPLLWALQSGVAMLLATPLSSLSDRVPRRWLLASGWLLYAAVFGVLGATVDTLAGIAVLLALYGVVLAMTEGVEKALVADLVPPERLGTAFGWFHLVTGLGLVPASAGFGWAWERFGAAAAFAASGTVAAFAAIALLVSMRAPLSRA